MRRTAFALAIGLLLPLGIAAPATASTAPAPKVVIVVGPVGSLTAKYRSYADSAAAAALQYTPNVVKVYSPNATWAAVKPALQGANIVIYLGHGNGYPSPYTSSLMKDRQDGMGLNKVAGSDSDSNLAYYGESYIASDIQLAPDALVILNHLCYASGNSEPGAADPTVSVAHQRIDNFAAGFIGAGAAAVIASSYGDAGAYFPLLFGTDQPLADVWSTMQYAHGNVVSFASSRSPGYEAYSDPDSPSGGYHRSLVVLPGTTTAGIIDGVAGTADDTRLAGENRFATAAAISASTFSPGVPVAYIATGYNFPDALAGAAVAGNLGGPVLLVAPDSIPAATATELTRLKPAEIVVLGSSKVVSNAVLSQLAMYLPH